MEKVYEKHKGLPIEHEPNFPGVATAQSSEWIIYIISFTFNPIYCPLGGSEHKHMWKLMGEFSTSFPVVGLVAMKLLKLIQFT